MDRDLIKMTKARTSDRGDRATIQEILSTSFFDAEHYARASGLGLHANALAIHYLTEGEKLGLSPSRDFDPVFYLFANPDVASAGESALLHYVRCGRREGRYPSRKSLLGDAQTVIQAGGFDEDFAAKRYDLGAIQGLSPVAQHLALWRRGRKPNETFDDAFYYNFYTDVRNSGIQPFVHYVTSGRTDGRLCNEGHLGNVLGEISQGFDVEYYKSQIDASELVDESARSAALHYLQQGYFDGRRPTPDFDPVFYLSHNKDISSTRTEPFTHYLSFGRGESRRGTPDFTGRIRPGGQPFIHGRPSIMIASHEASRTGAPLVGLNLIAALQQRYNVVAYLARGGEIVEMFREEASVLVVGSEPGAETDYLMRMLKERYQISALIMNSVETDRLASAAVSAGIASVALIHEFAEYTLPKGRVADLARRVDRIVVPARLVNASLQTEVEFICGGPATHVRVKAQGKLPWIPHGRPGNELTSAQIRSVIHDHCSGRKKIVLGAGWVGIRKGLDLFVQTAALVSKSRDDVAFLWVGGGYEPGADAGYSIWVAEMITRMGLSRVVEVIPEQRDLSAALEVADLFYLSSRMDPFPNVVIDALEADRPIVCFQDGTGCAELVDGDVVDGAAVPYCDVNAAADAILDLLAAPPPPGRNRAAAANLLDFGRFVAEIEDEVEAARLASAKAVEVCAMIKRTGAFDANFYQGEPTPAPLHGRVLADYVASASKGLARRNPRPGFSENLYRSEHAVLEGQVPLALALSAAAGRPVGTHACLPLLDDRDPGEASLRCALHIHLHYADVASDFARRLRSKARSMDILVTVTSRRALFEVQDEFPSDIFSNVRVVLVPNRGRDLGPFLINVPKEFDLSRYDVIGHLHGKKSLVLGGDVGLSWRTYLLDMLIGFNDGTVDGVLGAFARDERLGLLFPEDSNSVGWSKNLNLAREMCSRLTPPPRLPSRPIFPVGTMFWARPSALASLWNAKFELEDMPAEPVPYDGTVLHAIERLLPAVCEANGYRWMTVYKNRSFR